MRDTQAVGEWYTDENIASGMRLECTQEILSALDDIRQARGRKVENEAARDVIAILFHQMAVDELAADLGGMLRERGMVYMDRADYEAIKEYFGIIKGATVWPCWDEPTQARLNELTEKLGRFFK